MTTETMTFGRLSAEFSRLRDYLLSLPNSEVGETIRLGLIEGPNNPVQALFDEAEKLGWDYEQDDHFQHLTHDMNPTMEEILHAANVCAVLPEPPQTPGDRAIELLGNMFYSIWPQSCPPDWSQRMGDILAAAGKRA